MPANRKFQFLAFKETKCIVVTCHLITDVIRTVYCSIYFYSDKGNEDSGLGDVLIGTSFVRPPLYQSL